LLSVVKGGGRGQEPRGFRPGEWGEGVGSDELNPFPERKGPRA